MSHLFLKSLFLLRRTGHGGGGTSSEGLLRMNDETAMAGGKVFRPGGGNEPPLTDKGAELRQVKKSDRT